MPDKDPCDDVTGVSIPSHAHCTKYYDECPSKCKAWACDSGWEQVGNRCGVRAQYNYITDTTCETNQSWPTHDGYAQCVCYVTINGHKRDIYAEVVTGDGGSCSDVYQMQVDSCQYICPGIYVYD